MPKVLKIYPKIDLENKSSPFVKMERLLSRFRSVQVLNLAGLASFIFHVGKIYID